MIYIVPDIHGRSFWKEQIKGIEGEKIVFLGDYTDPYPDEGVDYWKGMETLAEVIAFKKEHMDNVVLLLGNHDLSYVSEKVGYCRHDFENHFEIRSLIKQNMGLFDLAHEERVGDCRIVFSHAGILPSWLRDNREFLGEITPGDEAKVLNDLFHNSDIYTTLGEASWSRGGHSRFGSPVWADIEEHEEILPAHLQDCFQVFGHSKVVKPYTTPYFACLDCKKIVRMDEDITFHVMG